MEVEIANSLTSVWPAKSTPSLVASNGPMLKRTCVPARVKTLTRTTEIAIGSVSRSEIRTSRPARPASSAAGRMATPMMARGPRYPPMTNAPSDSTVARTALVSGLRRWYGDGAAGASRARNAASSGVRSTAPPEIAGSIG
jgi:hypothetical protein